MKGKLLSRVRLFVTSWTAAYQTPPSMGFSRQSPCLTFLKCSGWAILNMKKLWGAPMPAISLLLMRSVFQEAHRGLWIKPEGWGFIYHVCVSNKMAHRAQTEENCLSNYPSFQEGLGRTSRCMRFLLWGIYEDSYHIYSSGERWSTCSILGSQGWTCFRYSSYLSIFLANYPEARKARSHLLRNTGVCRITGLKSTWASSGPILHLGQWLSAPTGLQNYLELLKNISSQVSYQDTKVVGLEVSLGIYIFKSLA